jgi:hypothetical protein
VLATVAIGQALAAQTFGRQATVCPKRHRSIEVFADNDQPS